MSEASAAVSAKSSISSPKCSMFLVFVSAARSESRISFCRLKQRPSTMRASASSRSERK